MNSKHAFSIGSMLTPKQVLDFSRSADTNPNIHSIWTPESWGKESFSILGAISQVTKNVNLGTSIVNIYSRSPATIAMGAITLDKLSDYRFILGIGSSTSPLIEGLHGINYEHPLIRMKEYINIIRMFFKSEKVKYVGRTVQVNNFKLSEHSRENIPIYLAAVNVKMINLAASTGDGLILYLIPISEILKSLSQIKTIVPNKPFTKAVAFITSVSNKDPNQANKRASKTLAFYISVGKIYYNYLLGTKYREIVKKISLDYHKFGIDESIKNITPEMLNDFVISGSVNDCINQLKRIRGKGVDIPILQINPVKNSNGNLDYKDFTDI